MPEYTKVYLERDGVTYDLSDMEAGYYLTQYTGLEMPSIDRFSSKGLFQNGVTDEGFTLDPRRINLFIGVEKLSPAEYHEFRRYIQLLFRPSLTPQLLKFEFPDGSLVEIAVHAIGPAISMPQSERSLWSQLLSIGLLAPDPIFYSVEQLSSNWQGSSGDGFEVPTPVPTFFGGSVLDVVNQIEYSGNWEDEPLIIVHGPINDLVITHETLNVVLDFTGHPAMSNTDVLSIDLRNGDNLVYLNDTTPWVKYLDDDSYLDEFRVIPGTNQIRMAGSNVDATTTISLVYRNRYIGV